MRFDTRWKKLEWIKNWEARKLNVKKKEREKGEENVKERETFDMMTERRINYGPCLI